MAIQKKSQQPAAQAKSAEADKALAAVTPPKAAELAKVPEHLTALMQSQSEVGSGFESMRQQDIIYPRIRLMQPSSEEVTQLGLPVGAAIDSVTKEVLMGRDERLEFLIAHWALSWIEWGDRDAGEGMIEMSTDPTSSLALKAQRRVKKEISKGTVLAVTEYYNFFVLLRGRPTTLYLLPCFRTSHKHGRTLLNIARSLKVEGRTPPIYAGCYAMESDLKSNPEKKQNWFEWKFDNAGWATAQEIAVLGELHHALKAQLATGRVSLGDEGEAEAATSHVEEENY